MWTIKSDGSELTFPNTMGKLRFFAAIIAVVAIGFMTTTLANYLVSSSAIRQVIVESDLPLTSDTLYSQIQQDLLKPTFVSSLMAQDTFLRDWILAGERDNSQITRYLAEIQEKYGAFTAFFVSEKTRTYYQSKGVLKAVSETSPRDVWFFRVRSMKTDYETNVDPDMANNDSITIFINHKVRDYSGNFIGAAGVGLQATSVKRLVESYQQHYRRTIYFVDQTGKLVLNGQSFDARESDIHKRPGLAKIASQLLSQPQGSFEYERNGDTILLNSRFIPELGWYLMVEQNGDEALVSTRRMLFLNILVGTLATTVVAALCALLAYRSRHRLERLAATDPLTGCFSRLAFDALLSQSWQRAQRHERPLSLAFLDLDHFKRINDRFGHHAGDETLRALADRLRSMVRAEDTLCRWGGEEFVLLLENCSLGKAQEIAETVRKAVLEAPFNLGNGEKIPLTVSIGVAEYRLHETGEDFVNRADVALYRAKQEGRNRTVVYADQRSMAPLPA